MSRIDAAYSLATARNLLANNDYAAMTLDLVYRMAMESHSLTSFGRIRAPYNCP